jgi:hypothetical protein
MADNLTAICEPIVYLLWDPQRLTTLWASMAWYRDSFTFFLRTYKAEATKSEDEGPLNVVYRNGVR